MEHDQPQRSDIYEQTSSLDSLRQEYISQPEIAATELEINQPREKLYFDRSQRLKIMGGMIVATLALAVVLMVGSGAWNRYTERLTSEVIFEEVPAELEVEPEPEPFAEEIEYELPEDESYALPLPEEYALPTREPVALPPDADE